MTSRRKFGHLILGLHHQEHQIMIASRTRRAAVAATGALLLCLAVPTTARSQPDPRVAQPGGAIPPACRPRRVGSPGLPPSSASTSGRSASSPASARAADVGGVASGGLRRDGRRPSRASVGASGPGPSVAPCAVPLPFPASSPVPLPIPCRIGNGARRASRGSADAAAPRPRGRDRA